MKGAIADVSPPAGNDLAGAQVVRGSKLIAEQTKTRFDLVSKKILEAAKQLSRAAQNIRLAMLSSAISTADVQEFREKVNELKTLFQLVRSEQARVSP